ncbi:MAG: hypothetical protein FWB86_00455 [Treponema sp.]|nr:hypothetical protein [Treponema sp.]MCL2252183.1 hypothetical protein [Treponema sp.]
MKENKFLISLLVLLLAAGTSAYAQANDSRINGTWVFDKIVEVYEDFIKEMAEEFDGPIDLDALAKEMGLIEMIITGTTYEVKMNNVSFGRGTYTAINGILTTNITHIFGNAIGLNAQWYSITELVQKYGDIFPDLSESVNYTISGNTLTTVNNYMKTQYRRK